MQELIFTFIKIALSKKADRNVISCDWYALLEAAAKVGVKGVVWQGIEIQKAAGGVSMDLDSMLEWWGQTRNTEAETKKMYDLSVEFAEKLLPIRCVVLKGIDYARYWPNPMSREFGDLDHWSGNDFDAVNIKAEEMQAKVKEEGYKNNIINYKGLTIENHRYFTEFNGTRQGKETERILGETIGTSFSPINGTSLLSPNANFTVLFMLRHAQLHFLDEGIELRHVLDWLFFLSVEQDNIDWNQAFPAMKTMGMLSFACVMTQMCVKHFGLELKEEYLAMLEKSFVSESLLEKFVNDIMGDKPEVYDMRLYKKALRILRRSKRMLVFRELLNESYLSKMWQSLVYNSITGIRPNIE